MRRGSILVVEDNPTARKMLRVALEAEGYRVVEASDGATALARATADAPDLIIQDLILPDMDGLELLRAFRALAAAAAVPIIALSGFRSLLEKARAEGCGFTETLMKPLEPSTLVEIIARHLPADTAAPVSVGDGRRVLVVDDDPIQLRLMVLRLKQLGFQVTSASDANAAVAAALAAPPDVVLSDVLMPDIDGFELCVRLRKQPGLAQMPIVLISAHYVDGGDTLLAQQVGANALLLRQDDLKEVTSALLDAIAAPAVSLPPELDRATPTAYWARIERQLKRQAEINAALSRRCALRAAQLSIVGGVADALARSEDVDTVFHDLLAACLDAGGISKGAIYRKSAGGVLKVEQAVGFSPRQCEDLDGCFGYPGLLVDVCAVKMVIPSRSLPPDQVAGFLRRADAKALVIIPLLTGGECIGGLLLGSTADELGDDDLLAFGRAIAAYINQALGLASAFVRLNSIAEVNRMLFSSLDVDETVATIARLGVHLGDHCEVDLAPEGKKVRWALADRDPAKEVSGRERRTVAGAAPLQPPSRSRIETPARTPGLNTEMILPLSVHGAALGTLRIGSAQPNRRYSETDLRAAEDLARRASAALYNARLYQEAQEASRAKDEFLATVSHELRTPLTSILLWTSKLLRGSRAAALPPEPGVVAIDKSARSLAKLIEDLLDVTSIMSGKLHLDGERVDLASVVTSAVGVIAPAAEARGIVIETTVDPEAELIVGDPARLQQVIWNLLNNAVKFTPGAGTIEVKVARVGGAVEMRIIDSGQGIEPAFLPFVFDRFRQSDSSSSRKHGGLGLGLSIVKHLVELHDGTVRAESAGAGCGATFVVTLPAPAALHLPLQAPSLSSLPSKGTRLQGLRLLVVEDEPEVRMLISDLLSEQGAEVRSAESAADGMLVLESFDPTVLVTDLGMPEEDGYHFIERVRLRSQIPALALTGYAGMEHRRRALDAGFQMHLAKPIEPAALLDAVAALAARPPS